MRGRAARTEHSFWRILSAGILTASMLLDVEHISMLPLFLGWDRTVPLLPAMHCGVLEADLTNSLVGFVSTCVL